MVRSRVSAALLAGLMLLVLGVSAASAQTTVTAAWDRNTDTFTAGYRVYYGTASGNYQWSVDAGNQVSAPINLSPGYVYYFVVRGYTTAYEYGPPSAEATIDLRSNAPTAQLTASMQSATTALVSWQTTNAVSANINGIAVGASGSASVDVTTQTTFTLTATAADGRTATSSATVTPNTAPPTASIAATLGANYAATITWQTTNAVSASINGISVGPSGSSSVTVSATTTFTITAVGATGATATASATVTVATVTAPGSPQNLAVSVSGSRATLNWQPPAYGGTPSRYLLYVGTASGTSNIANGFDVGNVLGAYGDLPRGTYYARVKAANSAGMSLNSNEVILRIGKKLRSPTGLTVTWTGTTATLSWAASSADAAEDVPSAYVLEAGTAPGSSNVAKLNVGNTTSFRTEVPTGNYYVRVRAVNALGESDPSEEIELQTPGSPQAPTALMSVNATGLVDLRWAASAGGYAATGYVVEAGSAPGLSDLARLQVGNVTRFTVAAPPGVYYVRVRGINATGVSLPSNEVIVRR